MTRLKSYFIRIILWPMGSLLLLLAGCGSAVQQPQTEFGKFAGAHARVVWLQHISEIGDDPFGTKPEHRLMGYDSNEGIELTILEGPSSYRKPLISPKGDRVVYSAYDEHKTYVVNWDGSDKRVLRDGLATDLWIDEHGQEWVYAIEGKATGEAYCGGPVIRYPIDQPEQREVVWSETTVALDNFQISADGKRAGGLFPWPHAGYAELPDGGWTKTGKGCWTGMAADNSYMMWVFDGAHRNLRLINRDGKVHSKVRINGITDVQPYEVYHPRWANHKQYFGITGPYKSGEGSIKIYGGGRDVEIYVGRLNPNLEGVEGWFQVTHNDQADFFPDVWLDPASIQSDTPQGADAKVVTPDRQWPYNSEGLEFIWKNGSVNNVVTDPTSGERYDCKVTEEGLAVPGPFSEMVVDDGSFITERADTIRPAAFQKANAMTLELVATPYEKTDEEKVIVASGDPGGTYNFVLSQSGRVLKFHVLNGRESEAHYTFGHLRPGAAHHIVIQWTDGILIGWVEGYPSMPASATADNLSGWKALPLRFGAGGQGAHDWKGRIEYVAVYSRGLLEAEVQHSQIFLSETIRARPKIELIRVEATLVEKTPPPGPKDLGAYRRALAVHTYKVNKVLKGKLTAGKIQVAHWAVLDMKSRPDPFELDQTFTLNIQRFNDHPELEGERLFIDSEEFDLDMYYSVDPR